MNRIKELRRLRNPTLTQQKLANLVGVARSTVAMWEVGKNEPDNETLLKLAELFDVSTDYILGASLDSSSNGKHPRMLIKASHWKSNKASRLYMCIDSDLLNSLDLLAKAANVSLEDEVEKILHEEVERRIEEETCETFLSVAPGALEVCSEQQKKPTPVTEDGLEEMFMRYVQKLTPDQQQMILDQMQRMTGQQKLPSSVFAQQITDETVQ